MRRACWGASYRRLLIHSPFGLLIRFPALPPTIRAMTPEALQELCETGQEKLMAMDYLGAEAALAGAGGHARAARGWDTPARLFMPPPQGPRQRPPRSGPGPGLLGPPAAGA